MIKEIFELQNPWRISGNVPLRLKKRSILKIILDFNELALRNDQGALFENFYLLELLKSDYYSLNKINFWRTTNQTEIDFIVTEENSMKAFEVKWDKTTRPKSFQTFNAYYPGVDAGVITKREFE